MRWRIHKIIRQENWRWIRVRDQRYRPNVAKHLKTLEPPTKQFLQRLQTFVIKDAVHQTKRFPRTKSKKLKTTTKLSETTKNKRKRKMKVWLFMRIAIQIAGSKVKRTVRWRSSFFHRTCRDRRSLNFKHSHLVMGWRRCWLHVIKLNQISIMKLIRIIQLNISHTRISSIQA